MKSILLVLDGLGDLANEKGKTPLSEAGKPNMNRMTKEGALGLMSTLGRGIIPGSDTAHLALFGYNYVCEYPGRGPLEALGAGLKLKKGDVVFRANLATCRNGKVVDRRAGRIDTASAKKLEKELQGIRIKGIEIIYKGTVEHRGVLILRGKGLSEMISPTDSHELGALPKSKALDRSKKAKKTAEILNLFTKESIKRLEKSAVNKRRKLKANCVIVRGAGTYEEIQPIEKRYGIKTACIAGGALYKGIAKYVGMDVVNVKEATGTAKTDLKAKGRAAVKALKNHDFVFLHVKATDSFSHDGDWNGKKKMIERVDKELIPLLRKTGEVIVVTGDHTTPCKRRNHSGHEVPVLFWGKDVRKDCTEKFDEFNSMWGGMGHIEGIELLKIILNLMDKGRMCGS
ncbi:2,3-bisphosphoglycerate-independent phosphoglycerate mutase [Candidatus Micrarchaeota archaeon]|nr:2,3-bisphosphoglycerate-independent phosphoglycerate mutase [Candidatus Micrarchaeota archaeon]